MYKLFLTLRYLRKRRIAVFAIIGVWLCVAMVVVVISVMGGFLDTLKERSRGLLSDIVIDNASLQGFPLYQEFAEYLEHDMPDLVVAATPVIYNYGILRIESTSFTKPVRVIGIHLKEYEVVNSFENSLFYERYYPGTSRLGPQQMPRYGFDDDLVPVLPVDHEKGFAKWKASHRNDPQIAEWQREPKTPFAGPGEFDYTLDGPPGYYGELAPGVIVGSNIINQRSDTGALVRVNPRGTKIILSVLPLTGGGKISGQGATTVVMRLADESRTRVYEIDDTCCYVDFDLLQSWLSMSPQELESGGYTRPRASQLLVSVAKGVDLQTARKQIAAEWTRFVETSDATLSPTDEQLLGFVTIETWEERQAPFIRALEKEKILMTVLFGLISVVAVVLIGCIFWMIVMQKTRDIGIIKSVGASKEGVSAIFVLFGATIGVVGALLGSVTGAVFVWYINDIQDALVALHPKLRVWSPDVYTFDRIPNVVKLDEVAIVAMVAVLAAMFGAVIPARLAGRVWPVKALRYE